MFYGDGTLYRAYTNFTSLLWLVQHWVMASSTVSSSYALLVRLYLSHSLLLYSICERLSMSAVTCLVDVQLAKCNALRAAYLIHQLVYSTRNITTAVVCTPPVPILIGAQCIAIYAYVVTSRHVSLVPYLVATPVSCLVAVILHISGFCAILKEREGGGG